MDTGFTCEGFIVAQTREKEAVVADIRLMLPNGFNPDWERHPFFVARANDGRVAGVALAEKKMVKQLRHELFQLNVLVLPLFHLKGVATQLLKFSFEELERANEDATCLGVYCWVSDDGIKVKKNEAIWPITQMAFLGNSPEGHQLRVRYFKKATI